MKKSPPFNPRSLRFTKIHFANMQNFDSSKNRTLNNFNIEIMKHTSQPMKSCLRERWLK